MRLPTTLVFLAALVAGCGSPPAEQRPAPVAAPAALTTTAPPAVTAVVASPAPQPAARTVAHLAASRPMYVDSLLPGPGRAAGAALAGLTLNEGGVAWLATAGVVLTDAGATTSAPGGAHQVIPVVAGTIRIQADVRAAGSGFTGIALGHGDLSGNFWANNELILLVRAGGYALQAGKRNLIPRADPALLHTDTANHLELVVDTVARTVTAQLNGTTVLAAAALPAEVKTDNLSAAGFRYNEPITAGKPLVSNPLVSAWHAEVSSSATTGLVPVDHAMCFVEPGQQSSLRWLATARGPTDLVPYTIGDYTGRQIDAGTATFDAEGQVVIARSFARGYYEITFPEAQQTFGIVALEAHHGPADPFFGMDSGLSWLELDPQRRSALVRILARCGIAMSRERMGLGAVNSAPGTYDWNRSPRAFDTMRTTYVEQKVPLLEMMHGGAKHLGMIATSPYPQDLAATATSWIDVTKHWSSGWGAAEVENEPDLRSVPADQYVSLAKTTSYALAEAGCTAPVVTGVFASIPPGPYFATCAANGLLADSDAISFHSYDRATAIESMVGRYRTWLAQQGAENLPLWHSECGWSWVNGPARPPRDQDADSACEIATKAVESMACGIARHFPFVYVYYEEGRKNFGMMGREATPLRSMAAYAMAASALSGRHYLGDLRGVGSPVQRARVFGGADGSCVAVLYTGAPDATARVHLPIAVQRIAGADGRELALVDGDVPVPDGMGFVWFDPALAKDALETATEAARLYAIGQHPLIRQRLASPIVLQFLAAQMPARTSASRYLVSQEQAHALPIHVRVQNLSAAPLTVAPALCLPGGKPVPAASITVPAHGAGDVDWTIDAVASLDIAKTRQITVTAQVTAGVPPSALAIPLVMDGSLEQHLAHHPEQRPLPISELNRWQPNLAGHGKSTFAVNDGVWRMTASFSGTVGNWVYPKFTLGTRLDPQHDSGFILRARILKPASGVAIMANPNTPGSFWCPDLFPANGEWHVVYVPFSEFKPGPNGAGMQNSRLDIASWNTLAIGMGSAVAENSLEISHLLVVGGGDAE